MATVTVKGRLTSGDKKLFAGDENDNFSAIVVLDSDADVKKLEAAKAEALEETFGSKVPKNLQDFVIREGDDPEFEASYEHHFINAKKKDGKPPKVVRKVSGEIEPITRDDDVIYAGCYVAASVNVYAYTGSKEKGILPGVTVGLNAVMFLRDGERLGGGVNVEDAFDGFESEIGEDDF